MTFIRDSGSNATNLEKHVLELRGTAMKTKQTLLNVLQKSKKRFMEDAKKAELGDKKNLLLKKLEKISKDLKVLNSLSEDEVIRFALSERRNLMAIAANKRMPIELRMKARLSCHKPLSTHLLRVTNKKSEDQVSQLEEDKAEKDPKNTTLDKITLNNYIVMMRKDVKRAKVHIIHKLTRIIRKLRLAKGSEEKKAKFQRKAERLGKKIIHIKEVFEDDLSKLALSTTQDLEKLANDIKAPMSSQAMATIATHRFVSSHISDFKAKFLDWQKTVTKLLKKKKKKRKLNLETNEYSGEPNKASQIMNNVNDKNASDESEEEIDNNEEVEESEDDEKSDDNEDSEHLVNQSEEGSGFDKFEAKNNEISSSDEDVIKNTVDSPRNSKTKTNFQTLDQTMDKCNSGIKGKTFSDAKVKKTKTKKPVKKQNSASERKVIEDEPKVVDPFFVTSSNEAYITSQVPKLADDISGSKNKRDNFDSMNSKSYNNNDFEKWGIKDKDRGYKTFNKFQDSAPFKKQYTGQFEKPQFSGNRIGINLQFANRKTRRKALHQPPVVEKVEKLHPSWEAKKKQSSIIPFQGKKVKFD